MATSGYKWFGGVKSGAMWFYVAKWSYVVKRFYVAKWLYVDKWFYVANSGEVAKNGKKWLLVVKSGESGEK